MRDKQPWRDEQPCAPRGLTPLAREIHSAVSGGGLGSLVSGGDLDSAGQLLPQEHPYPVEDGLLAHLGG